MKPHLKLCLDGRGVQLKPTTESTAPEVRASFNRVGKSVSAWARAHGFKVSLVYAVLEGRAKGNRGKSHNIAVLLGMKAGVVQLEDAQ